MKKHIRTMCVFCWSLMSFHSFVLAHTDVDFPIEGGYDLTVEDMQERVENLRELAYELENMRQAENGSLILRLSEEETPFMMGVVFSSRPPQGILVDEHSTPVIRDIHNELLKLEKEYKLPDKALGLHIEFEEGRTIFGRRKSLAIDLYRSEYTFASLTPSPSTPVKSSTLPPLSSATSGRTVSPTLSVGELSLRQGPPQNVIDRTGPVHKLSFDEALNLSGPRHPLSLHLLFLDESLLNDDIPFFQKLKDITNKHVSPIPLNWRGQIREPSSRSRGWRGFLYTSIVGGIGYGAYWFFGTEEGSNFRNNIRGRVLGPTTNEIGDRGYNPPTGGISLGFAPEKVDHDLVEIYAEIANYERLIDQKLAPNPLDFNWNESL